MCRGRGLQCHSFLHLAWRDCANLCSKSGAQNRISPEHVKKKKKSNAEDCQHALPRGCASWGLAGWRLGRGKGDHVHGWLWPCSLAGGRQWVSMGTQAYRCTGLFISLISSTKEKKGLGRAYSLKPLQQLWIFLHSIADSDDCQVGYCLIRTNSVLYYILLLPFPAGRDSVKSYLGLLLWLVAHNPAREQPFHMCLMPSSDQLYLQCV